jgi:hypothetical protein
MGEDIMLLAYPDLQKFEQLKIMDCTAHLFWEA